MVVHLHHESLNAEEKTGSWPVPSRFDELAADFEEHFACVQGLCARVVDEGLRRLVAELTMAALGVLHAGDRERAVQLTVGLKETNEQLQERVHVLLLELL
jgi:hypothetical protein